MMRVGRLTVVLVCPFPDPDVAGEDSEIMDPEDCKRNNPEPPEGSKSVFVL